MPKPKADQPKLLGAGGAVERLLAPGSRERIPVAMAMDGTDDPTLYVICNDGSYWVRGYGEWKELEPIPGTRRAKAWPSLRRR